MILIFGLCFSDNPKWVSRIGTLLAADFRSPATYFWFRCAYGSPVEDRLTKPRIIATGEYCSGFRTLNNWRDERILIWREMVVNDGRKAINSIMLR